MSDSGDSTTNDSYFDPSSPEHSPTSGCEEDKPQTVPRLGGTPPLSSSRTSSPALQTVPRLSSTPPQSPIDMRNRERIRLERRRESNRIAALKCHQRKLDRISELEQKVNALKAEKTALEYDTSVLRRDVYQLFQVVRMHIKAGCTM
ncbi:hypothetical protein HPB52_002658 [Rhipicephalus sanguineus]|uniref:BZIP domain-containing protein n=1 Tax=Rhipicephalus sanguineus TaxID=34632 RepID=A0A9D4SM69_RHISA|nr:hypothetical protein HPB52_002658 [Rhipicephalus sanguineus]